VLTGLYLCKCDGRWWLRQSNGVQRQLKIVWAVSLPAFAARSGAFVVEQDTLTTRETVDPVWLPVNRDTDRSKIQFGFGSLDDEITALAVYLDPVCKQGLKPALLQLDEMLPPLTG
jgi:hypothetical protein